MMLLDAPRPTSPPSGKQSPDGSPQPAGAKTKSLIDYLTQRNVH